MVNNSRYHTGDELQVVWVITAELLTTKVIYTNNSLTDSEQISVILLNMIMYLNVVSVNVIFFKGQESLSG